MNKQPCKDCKKRYLGCHSICPEYKEAVEEHKRIKDNRFKYKDEVCFHCKVKRKLAKK